MHKILEQNFYLYITVHLVRIWTDKNADEKAHTISRSKNVKKRTKTYEKRILCRFIFKHCWRCLLKRCDAGVDNAIKIIGACVTLHNICEMRGDFFNDEEHRPGLESDGAPQFPDDEDSNTTEAERIRNLIKDYLSTLASSGCYFEGGLRATTSLSCTKWPHLGCFMFVTNRNSKW